MSKWLTALAREKKVCLFFFLVFKSTNSPKLVQELKIYLNLMLLLWTKRNCLLILWFIGGVSDNHMTVDHVTVWEASSLSFWPRRIRRLLQPLLYEKHVRTNHLTINRTTSDLRKSNFYHSSLCSWSNYYAFILYGFGQLLLCTIYVYIKCLQFNFSFHVVFPYRTLQC